MDPDVSRLNLIFVDIQKVLFRRLLRIVQDRSTAEELAQEAYIRTRRSIEISKPQNIEALLWTTARNLAVDHLRKEKVRLKASPTKDFDSDIDTITDDRASIEDNLIHKDQIRIVQTALEKLPARARQCWVLSRIDGKSYPEIAAIIGVSPNTVFNDIKMVMAALYDLRKKLGD